MKLLLPILILAFSLTVFSQTDPVVEKIIEIGKTDNQTMDHLDVLCNRFGGRPIGSDAYEKLWIARCKSMQDDLASQR